MPDSNAFSISELWQWLRDMDFIRAPDFANALKPRHKNGKKRK